MHTHAPATTCCHHVGALHTLICCSITSTQPSRNLTPELVNTMGINRPPRSDIVVNAVRDPNYKLQPAQGISEYDQVKWLGKNANQVDFCNVSRMFSVECVGQRADWDKSTQELLAEKGIAWQERLPMYYMSRVPVVTIRLPDGGMLPTVKMWYENLAAFARVRQQVSDGTCTLFEGFQVVPTTAKRITTSLAPTTISNDISVPKASSLQQFVDRIMSVSATDNLQATAQAAPELTLPLTLPPVYIPRTPAHSGADQLSDSPQVCGKRRRSVGSSCVDDGDSNESVTKQLDVVDGKPHRCWSAGEDAVLEALISKHPLHTRRQIANLFVRRQAKLVTTGKLSAGLQRTPTAVYNRVLIKAYELGHMRQGTHDVYADCR